MLNNVIIACSYKKKEREVISMQNIELKPKLKQRKLKQLKLKLRKNYGTIELTLLALPAIIVIFIFNYVPLYGIILPFKDYKPMDGFFNSAWVGLENFKFIFSNDTLLKLTINTAMMNLLFIVGNTVISVIFALCLYELSRGFVKLYQTILFFPYFLSWVGVSYVLLALLDADRGIVNQVLKYFGNVPISWYNEPKYWHVILVVIYVWKMAGYGAVIYYAGLMGTSKEYYEAAKMDGANKLQEIWYISLPSLKPLIIIINILALGRVLNGDIGLFYNVTLDSPLLYPATDVIDTYVFRAVKGMSDIGLTSAVSLYQSVCGFILIMIVNAVVRKINEEDSLF